MASKDFYPYKLVLLVLFVGFAFSSCTPIEKMIYMKDIPNAPTDSVLTIIQNHNYKPPVLQTGDILNVTVYTLDPSTTVGVNQNIQFNPVGSGRGAGGGGSRVSGFKIDEEGDIDITYIGKVHVAGLTVQAAKALIEKRVHHYFKNAVVNVNLMNLKVTVLGEVKQPGTFVFSNEKVTLWDVLGIAGDLNITGQRKNVLLVRQQPDGTKKFVRLDINKSDYVSSPYFFMHTGDLVYVQPTKAKASTNNRDKIQTISIISSLASTLIMLITFSINMSKK